MTRSEYYFYQVEKLHYLMETVDDNRKNYDFLIKINEQLTIERRLLDVLNQFINAPEDEKGFILSLYTMLFIRIDTYLKDMI